MEKGVLKDILITLTIFLTDILYMPWGIFLPFFYSYLKQYDSSITFSMTYTMPIIGYFGNMISSFVMPNLLFILGIKKTFILGGLVYFFTTNLGIYSNKQIMFVFALFTGFCNNLKSLPTNYLLSVKYENGVQYLSYSYIGQSLGVLFWAFLMSKIINPFNKNMDKVTYVNGFEEFRYDDSVNMNFRFFFFFNGLFAFIIITFVSLFIDEPEGDDGNFIFWIKSFILRDEKAKKNLKTKKKNFTERYNSISKGGSLNSISHYNSKTSLIEIELLTGKSIISEDEKVNQLEKDIKETIKSFPFLMFIIITFIKSTSASTFVNCIKIIGNKIIKDDKLLSYIFSISCLADIFGRFLVYFTWKKIGFFYTYILNFCMILCVNFLFIIWGYESKIGFIVCVFLVSFCWAFGYLLGHTTLFALFLPEKAVGISKAFDTYFIFTSIYGSLMVELFISKGRFREGYFFFSVVEIFAGYLFWKYLRNFGDIKC